MDAFDPEKRPALWLSCALLAGAMATAAVVLLVNSLYDLSLPVQQSWLPVLAGGIAGFLAGRMALRLRGTSRRLEESEKRLHEFYRNTPALLHSLDDRGRILQVSQAWLALLGYDREEVIGKDFFAFVVSEHVEQIRSEHFQKLDELGQIRDVTYYLINANEDIIEVAISEVARRDAEGRITESLAVLSDLTTHRATEERI